MNRYPFTIILTVMVLAPTAIRSAEPDFDSYWHDGKAELDGYQLTVSRYGQPRRGHAVLIYVTEPFSESRRVKVDDPRRDPKDTFDVLKLNLVRDFQTGIYDYNTMVSVFARSADVEPVKVTFTSAEWCGHVYEELLFRGPRIDQAIFSYFEGESGTHPFASKAQGIAEDNLFIRLRGLRSEFLKPGQKRSVPFLPGAFHRRLTHRSLEWITAEIERSSRPQTVRVPAGEFLCDVYRLKISDGRQAAFFIENDYPHRIVRWELPPDLSADLTGTSRVPYWKMNGNGHERHLEKLGLEPIAQ